MRRNIRKVDLEDALAESWRGDREDIEVPLSIRSGIWMVSFVAAVCLAVAARIIFLGATGYDAYSRRAQANANQEEAIPAPRGVIEDRFGKVLADNRAVFSAVLNVKEFLSALPEEQARTESVLREIGADVYEVRAAAEESRAKGSFRRVVAARDLSQEQTISLNAQPLPGLAVKEAYERFYVFPKALASVVGYVGLPTFEDLEKSGTLLSRDLVGKAGIELIYDESLRGRPGAVTALRDAKGQRITGEEQVQPIRGSTLALTIDGEFQSYLYERLASGLASLGRTSGAAVAMDTRTGEVLALVSSPSFDPNLLSAPGNNQEKAAILLGKDKPLFNRVISGNYNPGSTIKPLHALAALAEDVIKPTTVIFSPGYLDIPNPWDPEHPTRYVDWRYQGYVDLSAALAQSSNVYFYTVGGGTKERRGIGIERLINWWKKLGLGVPTGIDMPSEAKGFLPSPDWKEETTGRPWLIGDSYNVSIGQGDLLVTPLQLIRYIAGIANNGKLMKPFLKKGNMPEIAADLSEYVEDIKEVQKGMREAVTSPMGTARVLQELPFLAAGKTGSAQVANNTQENAFFVGYAPYDAPEDSSQIALLILVERSRAGSLNAVPIAKDALAWYYEHRMK